MPFLVVFEQWETLENARRRCSSAVLRLSSLAPKNSSVLRRTIGDRAPNCLHSQRYSSSTRECIYPEETIHNKNEFLNLVPGTILYQVWGWVDFLNVFHQGCIYLKGSYNVAKKSIILCIWCNEICLCGLRFKKHIIFHIMYIIVSPLWPNF